MASSLVEEMWIEIWSKLDFDTLQKICTLVSKDWKRLIRGSTSLSSEMYLNLDSRRDTNENGFELLNVEDINGVLWSWPKLKTLYVSNLDSISRAGINFGDQLQIFGPAKFVENIAGLIENEDSHNLAFHYNDTAFVSFSSCQRNLIKIFQIEGMITLITKMTLFFSSDLLNGQK